VKYLLIALPWFLALSCKAQEVPAIDWAELQKTEPWTASEQWEPTPPKVTPGLFTSAPSDAIILFDGSDLSHWRTSNLNYAVNMAQAGPIIALRKKQLKDDNREEAKWHIKDGSMIVNPGSGAIETHMPFGSIQLHIEFLCPTDPGKTDQGYSNSGIFFMGLYEIQVLNSYENPTYVNGQAGALYKQHPPLVNASRPSGEWQAYDIIFNAPVFDGDQVVKEATITAFHNGVLIQNNATLQGPCIFIGEPRYLSHPDKLPLILQDHSDKVRYRNIWLREL